MGKNDTLISVASEEDRQKLLNAGFVEIKSSNGLYTFVNDNRKWNFSEGDVHIVHRNALAI